MKALIFIFLIQLISQSLINKRQDNTGKPNTINTCDTIPQLNKKVLAYAKSKIGKKVETGQCWDFAAEALNIVNANWDKMYKFGQLLNPETDCIYPGDIIQFEGVEVKYSKGNMQYMESMGHHTAIIYKVNSKGNFELAHQNFGYSSKKVGLTNLDIKNITKGEYFIYRPVK